MGRRGRTRGAKGRRLMKNEGWRGEEVKERLVEKRGVVEVREREEKGEGKEMRKGKGLKGRKVKGGMAGREREKREDIGSQ